MLQMKKIDRPRRPRRLFSAPLHVALDNRPDGATRRPIVVPETARTTRFHTFLTLRLGDRRLQRVTRPLQRLAILLARREFADDARFIRHVADTPESMAGMRLGKFDKPLVHNHRLLRTLYWGEPGAA